MIHGQTKHVGLSCTSLRPVYRHDDENFVVCMLQDFLAPPLLAQMVDMSSSLVLTQAKLCCGYPWQNQIEYADKHLIGMNPSLDEYGSNPTISSLISGGKSS